MRYLFVIWLLWYSIWIHCEPEPDLIELPANVLKKSIINFGQLTPRVKKKLVNNECLDMFAYGTSVTCAHFSPEFQVSAPDFKPRSFEDSWTFQLLQYLNSHLPPCYRDGHIGNHSFLQVRCYKPADHFNLANVSYTEVVQEAFNSQCSWMESLQLQRRNVSSKLLRADIIFVEPLAMFSPDSEKETETFMYSLLSLKSEPTVIYIGASFHLRNVETNIWQSFEYTHRLSDNVQNELILAKHYGIPFISAVDALGPFVTPTSRAWVSSRFILDKTCHLTRLGHQIVGLLVANYVKVVSSSLQRPFVGLDNALDTYLNISSFSTIHTPAHQLHETVTIAHPPLIIPLGRNSPRCYIMWMIDQGTGWKLDGSPNFQDKWGLSSSDVNGPPFTLVIPHESVHLHFVHQKLRVIVGKNTRDMGKLRIELFVFGHKDVLASWTVDCLLTETDTDASNTDMSPYDTFGSLRWFETTLTVEKKLKSTNSLEIKFSIVDSLPARDVNTVRLSSIHLS